jgi:hypothetical protein
MKLYPHQQEAVDKINGSILCLGQTGVGKSFVAWGLQQKFKMRALVLTKASVCEQLREIFTDNALVMSWNKFIMPKYLENDIYPFITEEPTILIADESSVLKNPASKTSKTLMKMRHRFEHVFMFTACQAPNTPFEYFVPAVLTTECFGDNFHKFMRAQAVLRRGGDEMAYSYEVGRLLARGWKVFPRDEEGLLKIVKTFTVEIDSKEVFAEMPDRVFTKRYFDLTTEQWRTYKQVVKENIALLEDDEIPITNKLAVGVKLQQVESGFFYGADKTYEISQNKTKLLEEIIEEHEGEQIIIFTQFVHECKYLLDRVPESTHDFKVFQQKQARFLIGHPASLGIGINLQNAHVMIFYSLSYSWELHFQSLGRIYRIGQDKPCQYYYLLSRQGLSPHILEVLTQKQDRSTIIHKIIENARKSNTKKDS